MSKKTNNKPKDKVRLLCTCSRMNGGLVIAERERALRIAPRAQKDRMLANEKRKFPKLCREMLEALGAQEVAKPSSWEVEHFPCYLETPLGRLHINVYDDWMPCRFEESARARAAFAEKHPTCNPVGPTGKYNCHVFHRCTAKEAVEHLVRPHLAMIWWVCDVDQPEDLLQEVERGPVQAE